MTKTCGHKEPRSADCDDCFIERMDEVLDLKTTVEVISNKLSPEWRVKFDSMKEIEKYWLALKAHDDGMITYTSVVGRKK